MQTLTQKLSHSLFNYLKAAPSQADYLAAVASETEWIKRKQADLEGVEFLVSDPSIRALLSTVQTLPGAVYLSSWLSLQGARWSLKTELKYVRIKLFELQLSLLENLCRPQVSKKFDSFEKAERSQFIQNLKQSLQLLSQEIKREAMGQNIIVAQIALFDQRLENATRN